PTVSHLSYTKPARRPRLPAHAKEVAFGASRKARGQLADDGANYRTARTRPVDRDDRLFGVRDTALPCALERQAHRLRQPFRPEIRCHARNRARHLVFISGVDRKRDEAEARVTDGDVVDVELERDGERVRFSASHLSSRTNMDTSNQATRDRSVTDQRRLRDRGCYRTQSWLSRTPHSGLYW